MTRNSKDEMQISEAELRAMTAQMNEMHDATFPAMKAALLEAGAAGRAAGGRVATRRTFFMGAGAVAGGLLLTACGSDDSTTPETGSTPSGSSGSKGGDNSALATNASLENLAVFAYGAALKAAPTGKFGNSVPPAVAAFAQHAMKQHQDHADAFNAALMGAGGAAFLMPDPALAAAVTKMFEALDSVPGLAMLALTLENTAGATYTKQMGELTTPEALSAVATIAPVERQHAAILSFVLGEYPVPDTFVKLETTPTSLGARPNTDAGV